VGIVTKVYDEDDTTLLASLTHDRNRKWKDTLSEVGTWSLDLLARDTEAAYLLPDRIVRFELDGVVRYGGVIAQPDRKSIDQAEEVGELLNVTGAGLLAVLDRAIVYPELGVGRLSSSQRYFTFAASAFDDSAWTAAVQIKRQGDTTVAQWVGSTGAPSPDGWPDPNAWWIWSRAQTGATPPQPVGASYFRKSFTLAAQTPVSIYITADDGYELYLDGDLVNSELAAFMWANTTRIDVLLSAGTHELAIAGTNIDRPSTESTNVAGILCSVMQATQGGDSVGSVIVHTDSSWKCSDYPTTAPTMTAGTILKTLIDEAQARGALTGLSYDFTGSHDSAGNAWTVAVDVNYQVGMSYLDVVRNLAGVAIDVRVDPATLTLQAYNIGTLGSVKAVTLEQGVHFTSLVHQMDAPVATEALIQYQDGTWAERTTGVTPRKETYLSLCGAPSIDQANRQADSVLALDSVEVVHVTWGCAAVTGAAPLVNWGVGDKITLPDRTDTPVLTRVLAIAVSELPPDQDGTVGGTPLYSAEATQ
jgi:hypothetical protein